MATTQKIHQLVHVSPDPCSYEESEFFVDNTLIGVEVELERVNRLRIENPEFHEYWKTTDDGSLRDGGKEYVLSRPFTGADLEKALTLFDAEIAQSGHPIQISDRTSVHIHVDVRNLTYAQLTKFVCIYAIFEEALFNFVGRKRKNNIFATSLSNAEGSLHMLGGKGDDPNADEVTHTLMHFTKYSACNIAAVATYGSLEFRNHEGTYDVGRIMKWINILLLMKKAATTLELPPQDIFSSISVNGTSAFFRDVFGEYSDALDYPNLEFDMMGGLRLAQDIIHSQHLEKGIEVPKAKDKAEGAYGKYYKTRKPKRFEERFKDYVEYKDKYSTGLHFGDPVEYIRAQRNQQAALEGIIQMRVSPELYEQEYIVIDDIVE